jgi:hypothetical protein
MLHRRDNALILWLQAKKKKETPKPCDSPNLVRDA